MRLLLVSITLVCMCMWVVYYCSLGFFCVRLINFAVNFCFSGPVQVIAWGTVSEMTYNVSSGTLNLTHSLLPLAG